MDNENNMDKENEKSKLGGCAVSTNANIGSIKFNPTAIDSNSYVQQTFGGSGIDNSYEPFNRTFYSAKQTERYRTKLSTIDEDDNIYMGRDHMHIQPANNGFVLTVSTCNNIETHVFTTFKHLLEFLNDNQIMDLDASLVAENI